MDLVKIGRASSVFHRLQALRGGSPVPLRLLWAAETVGRYETQLHRRFADRRSHLEWFRFAHGEAVELVVAHFEAEGWTYRETDVAEPAHRQSGVRAGQLQRQKAEALAAMAAAGRAPSVISDYERYFPY